MDGREEVVEKIRALVLTKYQGDWEAAWTHYATNDGKADRAAISTLLRDAGVGPNWALGFIGREILKVIDTSGDGLISKDELLAAITKEE